MPDPTAMVSIEAQVAGGKLRGLAEAKVATFRAVPYAAPPLGKLRFAPPEPHPGWSGTRDAVKDGPAPPQTPSRLEKVMGRVDFAQSEDCLTLNVWAPMPLEASAKRAVMVFFHGGAWTTGAGSLSVYSGAEMARAGGVVVVNINYRLGVLGYMDVSGIPGSGSGANRGLLDHVAALTWVRDNIANFGGDPANVTVFGQSAGGGSIAALMEMPEAVKLFRRAILMSAAIMPPVTREAAKTVAETVAKAAGVDTKNLAALRDVPAEKIIDAQRAAVMALGKPSDPTPLFRMVKDDAAQKYVTPAGIEAGTARGIDIMIGTTRDEVHAFFVGNEAVANIDKAGMAEALRRAGGDRSEAIVADYAKRHPNLPAPELFATIRTDGMFRLPSLRFAELHSKHDAKAYVYRFDWQPTPEAPYAAAHCIELPFVFGNFADWDAMAVPPAMLAGGNRTAMTRLSKAMQTAFVNFAKTGNPNHSGIPEWKPWTRANRDSLVFDAQTKAVTGLDDAIEKTWRG